MVSIARICEKLISKKPFLQEALSTGIINYSSLAETMQNDVESEYGKKVTSSAIIMGLRRLQEKLQEIPITKSKFSIESNIVITSDLFEFTIIRYPETYKLISKFYDIIDSKGGDFLTVTTGTYEITVICSKKYKNKFLKLVNKDDVLMVIDELSALTIKLPKYGIELPGIFYLITKALAWENINIVEIVSTYTDNTLILNSNDIGRAYNVLRTTIKDNIA